MIKTTSRMSFWNLSVALFAAILFAMPAHSQETSSVISNLCLLKEHIAWLDTASKTVFRIKRTAAGSQPPNAIDITGAERIWKGEPMKSPSSITVDESGNLYVVDKESASIYLLVPGSEPKLTYSGLPLRNPTGIAAAGSLLYVSDPASAAIFAFNLVKKEIVSEYKITDTDRGLERLKYSSGNLLALDGNQRVIYRFTLDPDKLKSEGASSGEWRTITDYSTISRSEKIDFSKAVTQFVDAAFANDVVYVIDRAQARLVLIPLDGGEPSLLPYAQLATEPSAIAADEDELVMAEAGKTSRLRRFPVLLPATLFFEGLRSSSQVVDFYRYLYARQLLPVRHYKVSNASTLQEFVKSQPALNIQYTPAFESLFCDLNARICQNQEKDSSKTIPTEIKLQADELIAMPDITLSAYSARRIVRLPLDPYTYNRSIFKDVFNKPLGAFAEKLAPEGFVDAKLRITIQKYNPWYSGPDILAETEGSFLIPVQAGRIRTAVPKKDLLNPSSTLSEILSQKNVTGLSPTMQPQPQSFSKSSGSRPWFRLPPFFINGGDCKQSSSQNVSEPLRVLRHCLPISAIAVPEVGVIDNKFNENHPAFKESDAGDSNLIVFKSSTATIDRSAVDESGRPKATDFVKELDHGTHITAIIGARNPNGKMMGVYPGVRLYGATTEQLSDFLSELEDIRLVNVSLGEHGRSDGAIRQNFDGTAVLKDIFLQHAETLFVVAAGNEGQKIQRESLASLGYLDNVLVVAASSTPSDPDSPPVLFQRKKGGSNFSEHLAGLAAPGERILSALYNGEYGETDGTSQATAFVTGVAAALMAVEPTWRAWQIKFRLVATADLWTHSSQSSNVLSGEIDMRRVVVDTGFVVTHDDVRGVCRGQIAAASLNERLELKNDSIPLRSILRVRQHPSDTSKYTIIYYSKRRLDNNQDRINYYLDRLVVSSSDMKKGDSFEFLSPSSSPCRSRRVSFKELKDFVNNFSAPSN